MSTFNFSPSVLEWAANNIGLRWRDVAESIVTATTKREEKLTSAYNGTLTIKQAETVAKKTHVPYGFLFLSDPPKIKKPSIPDLRQTANPEPLSIDFQETLEDILNKQSWYIDYLNNIESANKLEYVNRFPLNKNPSTKEVSNNITATLGLTVEDRKNSNTPEDFFNVLSKKIEDIGILVFRSGIVKSSTSRALSEKEFRGFALVNEVAPAIFINGKDAKAAWVFTLMHEICHIWIGENGVSNMPVTKTQNSKIETFCNKVAAEILVPEKIFLKLWNEEKNNSEKINILSKIFKVSTLVIARRAFDLGNINWDEYKLIEEKTYIPKSKNKNGGDSFRTMPIRNSRTLTRAVVNSAASGDLLFKDAGRLLNVRPSTIVRLRERIVSGEL